VLPHRVARLSVWRQRDVMSWCRRLAQWRLAVAVVDGYVCVGVGALGGVAESLERGIYDVVHDSVDGGVIGHREACGDGALVVVVAERDAGGFDEWLAFEVVLDCVAKRAGAHAGRTGRIFVDEVVVGERAWELFPCPDDRGERDADAEHCDEWPEPVVVSVDPGADVFEEERLVCLSVAQPTVAADDPVDRAG
jgi:hypothetical protein